MIKKQPSRSSCSPCSPARDSDNDPDPGKEPGPAPGEVVTYGNESLVAVDPAGKEIAFDYRAPRDKKSRHLLLHLAGRPRLRHRRLFRRRHHPAEGHGHPVAHDISELEKGHSDPADIPFGPGGAMHHWGKPYLDYYVSNDTWVIRRHAQMLSEAGVDVIFIDVTNGYAYLPVVRTLCDVYDPDAARSAIPDRKSRSSSTRIPLRWSKNC